MFMQKKTFRRLVAVLFLVILPLSVLSAEEALSQEEAAAKLANPNVPLAKLLLKNQYTFYKGSLAGADEQSNFSQLFQPSFPFPIKNATILWRPALPIQYAQPKSNGSDYDKIYGLGDISMDVGYAVTKPSGLIWFAGVFTTIPTATRGLGGKRWTMGPEAMIGVVNPKFALGSLVFHQWKLAGSGTPISTTGVQAFAFWLPGGGWAVGSGPILSFDWKTNIYTIPLNLTVSRTYILGRTPWKFDVTLDYYVKGRDTFSPEWVVGFNITPVIKNIFYPSR